MPPLSNSISQVPQEVFETYIVEKLYKENPHLGLAFNESDRVLGGAVVHIPQAGKGTEAQKNRKVFPAVAVQRKDTMISYPLDVWSTDPDHITWHEGAEISYDKTDSVLSDHVGGLIEAIGDNMLYNWIYGYKKDATGGYVSNVIPASNIITTSGNLVDVNPIDGQLGKRKSFSYKDLQTAQAMMDKQSVSKQNRYALLESYMKQQLIDSLSPNQMAAFQQSADLSKGIIGAFAGFQILDRSSVLAFSADNKPLVPGQALSETDHLACLCWQKDSVTIAKGDIVNFERLKDPLYYGDIFSALVKFGGRCRREDWKGVIAIVQGGDY